MDLAYLLGDLDEPQRAAVTTPSTLVAVIAAAGSGKTRVLARRIAYRVATDTADARHTLALTFTREAAGELQRRLLGFGTREMIEAGTFHSVALAILRQRWTDIGQAPPTVISDPERLISEIRMECSAEIVAVEQKWIASRGIRPDNYVGALREAKRHVGAPPNQIANALDAYETLKRHRGVVDLDDLIALLSREIHRDPPFADAVQWRFRHILVDEAQDLNPVQYRLLRQLSGTRSDLFLVGDPAQAIYSFNGSDPGLLIDVERHLPGVEVVHLDTNRRCTPAIINAGLHVLRVSNQPSYVIPSRSDSGPVELIVAEDETHEARLVADLIRRLERGFVRSGGVAVLARTNLQLKLLEAELRNAGVPVRRHALARGSHLSNAVSEVGRLTAASHLRDWAHEILEVPPPQFPDELTDRDQAQRRVAAAVLEFLRMRPLGDGHELRRWIAGVEPFAEPGNEFGVELSTFHAAKGREWHTVIITGVESGLVPHRAATGVEGRLEEARLLHVAITRAIDRLVISRAERRRGYERRPSPFIVGLPTEVPPLVGPPDEIHRPPDPTRLRTASLIAWRSTTARATAMLPAQICSDDDLTAIATTPPSSPEELAALTGFGPIAAAKLFQPIKAALDAATTPPDTP